MSDRNERLAVTIERQSQEMLEFLGGLTESDLRAPCADPGGSTVGAVVAHLSDGYGQVLGWIERVAREAPAAAVEAGGVEAAGGQGSAGSHEPDGSDPLEQVERLRRGGPAWVALVRDLSDGQLDRVPPAAVGIADGSSTLAEIMDLMIEHQATHLDHIKRAVLGSTELGRQPA